MRCKYVGSILYPYKDEPNSYIVICDYDKHRPFAHAHKHNHVLEVPKHIPQKQIKRYIERIFKGSNIPLREGLFKKLKYLWEKLK